MLQEANGTAKEEEGLAHKSYHPNVEVLTARQACQDAVAQQAYAQIVPKSVPATRSNTKQWANPGEQNPRVKELAQKPEGGSGFENGPATQWRSVAKKILGPCNRERLQRA